MKQQAFYTCIHAEDSFIILNKRSGISVGGERWAEDAIRLDNEAEKEFGELYTVHRIDKETSGLIIYARNSDTHRILSVDFANRSVAKTYHALIYGRPQQTQFTVDDPLLADGDMRHRTIVSSRGKPSITHFRLIGICGAYSWIEAQPETGRTHQIRAHLSSCGLSIVCDPLYGGNQKPIRLSEVKRSWRGDSFSERPLLNRLALHARSLAFAHPQSKEPCFFEAAYQKDMEALRKQFVSLFRVDPLMDI